MSRESDKIVIGIVENASRTAVHSTGRQFRDLLSDAAQDLPLQLRIFFPPGPSGKETKPAIEELWTSKLDGLVVTGTEPRSSRIVDEPCWPFISRLVDWAEDNTISTLWSCLATHAAVYRLDGIERQASGTKLFGLFDCTNLYQHAVLDHCPRQWKAPHSRYNGLPEKALIAHGYRVLTQSAVAGVDSFMKQGRSLHFFLQGHPEYDLPALSREYRRDVKRFLSAESDRYPKMPVGYFAAESAAAFAGFRRKALKDRSPDLFAQFPRAATTLGSIAPWRQAATQMCRNWLEHLADQKAARINRTECCSVPGCPAPGIADLVAPSESV